MKLTLTYEGQLPPIQRGISKIKADLRRTFHPQIKAQIGRLLDRSNQPHMTTRVGDYEFISPAHSRFRTAVELDILLLTPPGARPGDVDNRLKTLIDGLTRPANPQQFQGFTVPADHGPTFCLMDDDSLVQRIGLDSRGWHMPGDRNDALVVITASLVLSEKADLKSPLGNLFFIL